MNAPKEGNEKKGFLRSVPPILGVLAFLYFLVSLPDIWMWVGDNYYLVVHGERRTHTKGPYPISGGIQYTYTEGDLPESELKDNSLELTDLIQQVGFHPNGESVLLHFCPTGSNCYLLSYDIPRKQTKIVFKKADISARDPNYSPDGKWIVFSALFGSEQLPISDPHNYSQVALIDNTK